MRAILLIALVALPAAADPREAVYGVWGTPQQCAREPILPGGSKPYEPYEIGPQWLKHGDHWCSLDWFPVQPREGGVFTGAQAICGEDGLQGYMLGMEITGDTLRLRQGALNLSPPLQRCAAP